MKWVDRLYLRKVRNNTTIPCCGISAVAGYDLSSTEDVVIPGKGKEIVKTGLVIAIPEGTYARIAPRLELAVKSFIDMGVGVVDDGYHGKVGAVLFNQCSQQFPGLSRAPDCPVDSRKDQNTCNRGC